MKRPDKNGVAPLKPYQHTHTHTPPLVLHLKGQPELSLYTVSG